MTYPHTVEYGDIKANHLPVSTYTILYQRTKNGREYKLVHRSAGYEPAGSAARYTNKCWSVDFWLDNARHGRRFTVRDKADEYFDRMSR